MPTFFRPSLVTLGPADLVITTVTQVSVNENFASGSFAGDDNAYAAGWVGVGVITGSITLADVQQGLSLIGASGSLKITHKATGGGTDVITTVANMQIAGRSMSQPFDANSGITLNLVYVGVARSSGNNPVSVS